MKSKPALKRSPALPSGSVKIMLNLYYYGGGFEPRSRALASFNLATVRWLRLLRAQAGLTPCYRAAWLCRVAPLPNCLEMARFCSPGVDPPSQHSNQAQLNPGSNPGTSSSGLSSETFNRIGSFGNNYFYLEANLVF